MLVAILVASPTGLSGTVKIVAPLPCEEGADSPYTLVAVTVAMIGSPSCSRKGVAYKVNSGIVHLGSVTRAEF